MAAFGAGPAAERYDAVLVPAMFTPLAAAVAGAADVAAGDRVLDVACGTGALTRELAARVGEERVVGADLSEGMLELARANVPGVRFLVAGAGALPFGDGEFTVVTCQQGIQFVDDPAAALGEFRRVLAPGGRTAVACWTDLPGNGGFHALVAAAERHLGEEAAGLLRSPFGVSDPARLRGLLAGAGFDEVVVEIERVEARFPVGPSEFADAATSSGPAASTYLAVPEERRRAFALDVAGQVERFADGDGLVFEMPSLIARGTV